MLTLFGLWLPLLVAGSLYVEAVFAWPGLGTLAAEAIAYRDYPVIMGTTILVSGVVVLGNLAADLAHRWLDPRLRTP
jgi:peptide/nickel transport system permease protein